ncbi:MAG TPA: substrate-binding domain-containing protein [Actinoplanes sp.]|nr:substrate-binding domain-containing protein [Actinoplanes sp.]
MSAWLVVGLAACGQDSTPGASSACGTLPAQAPQDPDGVLAEVNRNGEYDGWPYPVRRSELAQWRPKGEPPYTVGVILNGNVTPFQAAAFTGIQRLLRESPAVEKVLAVAPGPGNPTQQVQAYQSMIDQGADLIVLQPASAPAFTARIRSALQQGVATLSIISVVDDAAAVNLAPNVHTGAGAALAAFVKLLGGKGNLLGVHGIRATEADRVAWETYRRVLALCPDIELVGEIDGNYAPPTTRAAVLQFLATHPVEVQGVFHTAAMGPSIIGAFQQAGRPVPPVTAMVAQKGELAYWAEHAGSGYATAGFLGGPASLSDATARTALRLLAGQGPKANAIPLPQPLITGADLDRYVQPGWTLATPGDVEQDRSSYVTEQDLDTKFNHPDRKPGAP